MITLSGIEYLRNLLEKYRSNANKICINIKTKYMVIRNCIIPEDILIDNDNIYISDNIFIFEINLKDSNCEVKYCEIDDSICIQNEEIEMYIDF